MKPILAFKASACPDHLNWLGTSCVKAYRRLSAVSAARCLPEGYIKRERRSGQLSGMGGQFTGTAKVERRAGCARVNIRYRRTLAGAAFTW